MKLSSRTRKNLRRLELLIRVQAVGFATALFMLEAWYG